MFIITRPLIFKSYQIKRKRILKILILYLLISSWTPVYAQEASAFVCKAPSFDTAPCQTSSNLAPSTEPTLDLAIGNPVNMITGEKFLHEIDLPENINNLALGFSRLYRSGNQDIGVFGIGWRHSYEIKLKQINENQWQLSFPNSAKFIIHEFDSLKREWLSPDGRLFSFNAQGQILALSTANGSKLKIKYYKNGVFKNLIKEITLNKFKLEPIYKLFNNNIFINSLATSLGNFQYHYKNANLVKVRRPDGMYKTYHYEESLQAGNKNLITGISIIAANGNSTRLRTWHYDKQGRVLKSISHNKDFMNFVYDKNKTHVYSKNGKTTFNYKKIANRFVRLSQNSNIQNNIVYDANARLKRIDNLYIKRYQNGMIKQLKQDDSGWQKLTINFDKQGKKTSWSSSKTGVTNLSYDSKSKPSAVFHANGNYLKIEADQLNRPIKLYYFMAADSKPLSVSLTWHGQHLVGLKHPNEDEFLQYNHDKQLSKRIIRRRFKSHELQYEESFKYNSQGQIIEHLLPEGGKLIYNWNDTNLMAIRWHDKQEIQTVIRTKANYAGYEYGNKLHMQGLIGKQRNALILSNKNKIMWGEYRNNKNNLLNRQVILQDNLQQTLYYFYDQHNKTIAINSLKSNLAKAQANYAKQTTWLAWNNDGSLRQQQQGQISLVNYTKQDASGLSTLVNDLQIKYQAQQRPSEIRRNNTNIASYYYNARGQRIRQVYANSAADRLYVNNRLAAIWGKDTKQRFIYALGVPVGLLQTDAKGKTELFYIHANQIGAPVLVSDSQQNIVWQASYDHFGKANIIIDKINMPLRLPGQDVDPITGLHDNVFRTYDPTLGQYLEPDPLGPVPGQQAYGYAKQQAQKHQDPLGLILLAFDGTRYNSSNEGNVWKLAQAYTDGPSYYHHGPGNSYYLDWDAVVASSSRQIQDNQWQSLLNALEQAQKSSPNNAAVPIDILGYSRGAALARDFANKIALNTNNGWFSYDDPLRGNIGICVNLRFLGLFDTVAQFGLLGANNAGYNLNIADAWQWVAHAVASHELRTLFPLVSAASQTQSNIIEAPFIGAHADIGGGMVLDADLQTVDNGDLSDVSLNWMLWQALAANVNMHELDLKDQFIREAILHDERSAIEKNLFSTDRDIQDANNKSLGPQGAHPILGEHQRAIFEEFIQRSENTGTVAGVIDMLAYNKWLQEQYAMPSVYE